jgi:hypothetical protein
MPRYFHEIDVDALFRDGATSFRLDAQTAAVLCNALKSAAWFMPDLPDDVEVSEYCPALPKADLGEGCATSMFNALNEVLQDTTLMAPFQQFSSLITSSVEAFNGAIDTDWHHDGLAGKRGHPGEFFLLCYLDPYNQGPWDEKWGGAFEFGERHLDENWVHHMSAPDHVQRIVPQHRTCVLGWNENPRLIHRSAPLKAPVNRYVVAASIRKCADR